MKYSLLISALLLVAASAFAATQGTIVDKRDGKKYKTVKIGDQTWMAENLNYEMQDSYCYSDDESNCSKYGRLYTSKAAKKACPSGWHLPSKGEFETLFSSVGGKRIAGKSLKSKKGWYNSGNGSDAFGFSALPAGYEFYDGDFGYEGGSAYFWSSTEGNSGDAYYMSLGYGGGDAGLYDYDEDYRLSVRCLQDDNGLVDKRDGKMYRTVKIGDQTWMAENLNYKTKNSYCYDGKSVNCSKYGRLYLWKAAKKACPNGWHLPSKTEFETLLDSVGGKKIAGKSLKSKIGWKNEGNGTDAFGFSALPAGGWYFDGGYISAGGFAYFWSSTEGSSYFAYDMALDYGYGNASLRDENKDNGYSVRCLKD